MKKLQSLIEEPLEDLAWQAFRDAPKMCDEAYGCAPYHRFWSIGRLLRNGGVPPRGGAFFARQLAGVGAQGERIRVLIAGAADSGVPMMVANAAIAAGRVPALTVVDRCATPVAQIATLADKTGLEITGMRGLLDQIEHAGFDVAITHNVMLFNTDAQRQEIYSKLAKGLRRGGRVLSMETVSDTLPPRSIHAEAGQVAKVRVAVEGRDWPRDVQDEVVAAAEAFLGRQNRVGPYPERDLRRHVEGAGLVLRSLETSRAETEASTSTSPRWLPGKAGERVRAFVVAEKPA